MPGDLCIWTTPPGADWTSRALQWSSASAQKQKQSPGLWIVPTALARDHWTKLLVRHLGNGLANEETVWSWEDLWRATLANIDDAPACLSTAAARTALLEAIARSQADEAVKPLGTLAHSAGFRRRLQRKFAAWTLAEQSPAEPPFRLDQTQAADWAIFARYQRLLEELNAIDEAGLAPYCSRVLQTSKGPTPLQVAARVLVADLTQAWPSTWRVLERLRQGKAGRDRDIRLTIPGERKSSREEAFEDASQIRQRLLESGYREESVDLAPDWPLGLRTAASNLFRDDVDPFCKHVDVSGLRFQGGPAGEEIARLIALEIDQKVLKPGGIRPEEMLVLFRTWDEEAELILDTLRHWGLPVSAEVPRPLRSSPTIQALRLALRLTVDDWDAETLAKLLRHGLLRLQAEFGNNFPAADRAAAAAVIRDARVFRGRQAIRDALIRLQNEKTKSEGTDSDYLRRPRMRRARRATLALPIFDRLVRVIPPADYADTWPNLVETLARMTEALGIGGPDVDLDAAVVGDEAIDHLFNALDDHGDVWNRLGRDRRAVTWPRFVQGLESLIRDLQIPTPSPASNFRRGTVRLASVEEAAGVRVPYVLLANLGEGSFPIKAAVDPDRAARIETAVEAPIEEDLPLFPDDSSTLPTEYGREMLRFLNVLGSARQELTLIYPTTDEKGQSLLPAGFLEDLRSLFDPKAIETCKTELNRLDPTLLEAGFVSPGEARVRAVADAALEGNLEALKTLAASPRHRPALLGTAEALKVSQQRSRAHPDFGPYEGRLQDQQAIEQIAKDFGPDYRFSPSQLESLAFCPFQFFQRYVLRLDPIEERDELGDDFATRGSMIHGVLEQLHKLLEQDSDDQSRTLADRVKEQIESQVRSELKRQREPVSQVEAGLRLIEAERMVRTGKRYADQFALYAKKEGKGAKCHSFEAQFGTSEEKAPPLDLGSGADRVRLQGVIDRIDLQQNSEHLLFRVIDYKSGGAPSEKEVHSGQALQLPLYALAAQRLLLADLGALPIDAGYWALKKKGYRAVVHMAKLDKAENLNFLDTWEPFAQSLEAFVVALVSRLRAGALPVAPSKTSDCENYCDYRTVCRIRQVRSTGKVRGDLPNLEVPDGL